MRYKKRNGDYRTARIFGITIDQLRQQRLELGQLTSGPYAGCSPEFASFMELLKKTSALLKDVSQKE